MEAERIAALDASPLRPVTLSLIEGRQVPTLAEAAASIEAARGELRVVDGRLEIWLQGSASPYAGPLLLAAPRTLYFAESAVVEHLEAGRALPDVEITPNGAPITRGSSDE